MESHGRSDVTVMGLDGGTRITRSDVLRGQSWRLTTQDDSRSTRGGCVSTSETVQERRIEKQTAKSLPLVSRKCTTVVYDTRRRIKWSTCALSEQPLEVPVVVDYLGNLYNKATVLTFLLNRRGVFEKEEERHFHSNVIQSHGARFEHLRRRRDVFELKIGPEGFDGKTFICPVSHLSALSTPFSALASCGHVFSDRAIEEMRDGRCMECAQEFRNVDVVHLNCENESQKNKMRSNLKKRKKRTKDTLHVAHKRKTTHQSQNSADGEVKRA